jgi:hypothetical protein
MVKMDSAGEIPRAEERLHIGITESISDIGHRKAGRDWDK